MFTYKNNSAFIMNTKTSQTQKIIPAKVRFKEFIIKNNHPCIMAQTVFKMDEVTIKNYDALGTRETAQGILKDLEAYLKRYSFASNSFETFIATFPTEEIANELAFEKKLWQQLTYIHTEDTKAWDPTVDKDPESANFSFSILGKAFYIVGLHPNSSRKARQSPYPSLVFNLHHQFEKLREMGTYKKVRNRIRRRDKKLQGTTNPVLADFGDASEALQYSGRNVGKGWECPFKHMLATEKMHSKAS